jgi:hypothetical protein
MEEKPDLLLDIGYYFKLMNHNLKIKNITYDSSYEYKRLVGILDDLWNRLVIFIRFNPEEYLLKDCSKNNSCWSINNKGL